MTLQELVGEKKLDLEETIVELADGSFRGMLCEFVEVNWFSDFGKFEFEQLLELVQDLLNTGEHHISVGNGEFETLRVVRWSSLDERNEE